MAVQKCAPQKGREKILNPYTGKCVFKDGKVGMWLLGANHTKTPAAARAKTPGAPRKFATKTPAAPKNSKTCKKSIFHYPWKVLKHSSWFLGWVFTVSLAVYLYTKLLPVAVGVTTQASGNLATAGAKAISTLGNATTHVIKRAANTTGSLVTNQATRGLRQGINNTAIFTQTLSGQTAPEILYANLADRQTKALAKTYAESCLETANKLKIDSSISSTIQDISLACSFTTKDTIRKQQELLEKVLNKEVSPNILYLLKDTVLNSPNYELERGYMHDEMLSIIDEIMKHMEA